MENIIADRDVLRHALSKRVKAGVRGIIDSRYTAKLVETEREFEAVLGLRSDVFRKELRSSAPAGDEFSEDLDEYDLLCDHIIVSDNETGRAVGTYRLNTIESALVPSGFYAHGEFAIEDIPDKVLSNSVELGRACIAADQRNSRVLFLLWKVLANFMTARNKRYAFGCCSIFTTEAEAAAAALTRFHEDGLMHDSIVVHPREEKAVLSGKLSHEIDGSKALPALVEIYMRIGARVCGEPAIDREMGTTDFFVIFDVETIAPKYHKMFFGGPAKG